MTKEFGRRVEEYLTERGISKNKAAYDAHIDRAQIARVTHGDRELGPDNLLSLIDAIGVPPQNQAMFLLQGMSVPEQIAQRWLEAFLETDETLKEMSAPEEMQKYIQDGKSSQFAAQVRINKSNILKIRHGLKGVGRERTLRIAEAIEMPEGQKAQFFLTEVDSEFKDIKRVLENYRNALTPEQEEIMALGYKPDSIAVKWGIDPIA